MEALPTCESCLERKIIEKPFPSKVNKAMDKLELIHFELYGLMNTQTRGGFEYFVK